MKFNITGGSVEIDPEDFITLSRYKWCIHKRPGNVFCATTNIRDSNGKYCMVQMHRFIMGLVKGDKRVVDHINHNTLDNRKENLRVCTQQQNLMNRRFFKSNTSGVKGVHLEKKTGRWISSIMLNKKVIYLGTYDSIEDAKHAREVESKKLFGEYRHS